MFEHKDTADHVFSEHADIKLGFVVRDPIERANSGFFSRLRQGRPKNQSVWRTAEAIAFQYFSTFNELAEALSSSDERLKSAAIFSLNAISHVRRGYVYYFDSVQFLEMHRNRFYAVSHIEDLDQNAVDFFPSAWHPRRRREACSTTPTCGRLFILS